MELSIIKETIRSVAQKTGKNIDMTALDLNEKSVFEQLCSGDRSGVFYFDEDVANNIYDRLCEEAPCCFNKSHAAAFSLMIYGMAWLKCHYRFKFDEAVKKYKGMKLYE